MNRQGFRNNRDYFTARNTTIHIANESSTEPRVQPYDLLFHNFSIASKSVPVGDRHVSNSVSPVEKIV